MAERTITLNSLGKTFSVTGWKIGWAIAPPPLTAAVRAAHQFLTFATSAPMQHAAAAVIGTPQGESYIAGLVETYGARRAFLLGALADLGFTAYAPAGSYFIMADHSRFGLGDDAAFCRHITTRLGVAAIPPGAFYSDPARGAKLARFAFCKRQETLAAAVERLAALRRA
jgi:aspartate/methionine/tyrosine aminotransferase